MMDAGELHGESLVGKNWRDQLVVRNMGTRCAPSQPPPRKTIRAFLHAAVLFRLARHCAA
jgi:hypothetical protein